MSSDKLLVTSALPYANGPLHLGHLVEHIQTDIWVRMHKLLGHDCIAVCGEDAHGTPIMLKAEQQGITPEELINQTRASHESDFAGFSIDYDYYHTTHSEENRQLAQTIYQRLKARGDIVTKTIKQAFDPEKNMFLPDRFVKGTCPKCHTDDQYGDNCEACGATYAPTELIKPKSAVSGATPIEKETEHFFFDLPRYEGMLKEWIQGKHLQPEVANKLKEWFEAGLKQWDITRDAPYFGFEIPGETDKYFYVWMDAPIGYMASFKKYCDENNVDFDSYWAKDSTAKLYHFVGKDIIYFHALFWPAVLTGSDHRTPTAVYTHGFLTVNGQKMSKSRGTFIQASDYLTHLNPEYLRYYFAAKLSSKIDDIDLNFEDFTNRVNADLVGKVINIASRCASFINKRFDNQLADTLDDEALYQQIACQSDTIAQCFIDREYAKGIRLIMQCADHANQYIDANKPWVLIKDSEQLVKVQQVCTMGLNCFRLLILYLKPVLPTLAREVEAFLNVELTWDSRHKPLLNHTVNKFKPLMQRVEADKIDALLADSAKQEIQEEQEPQGLLAELPISEEIEFDDFAKIDLRVAKIIHAEHVEGADKLLRLQLDIGGETRQVFAGIKSAFSPDELIGQLTVMVANLKPRKMRFGLSEGMVIVASGTDGAKDLWLIKPESGSKPGMRVK